MVALTLGEFHVPTKISTNLIRALRSFDKHLERNYPMLKLPYSLRIPDSPEVKVILIKGSILYFAIGKVDKPATYIGGINLLNNNKTPTSLHFTNSLSVERIQKLPDEAKIAIYQLNLSQLAREVPLKSQLG